MIIVDANTRNANVLADNLQLKMLVNLLRQTTMGQYVEASEVTNRDGFSTSAAEVQAAVGSANTILGRFVDQMKVQAPAVQEADDEPISVTTPPYSIN